MLQPLALNLSSTTRHNKHHLLEYLSLQAVLQLLFRHEASYGGLQHKMLVADKRSKREQLHFLPQTMSVTAQFVDRFRCFSAGHLSYIS